MRLNFVPIEKRRNLQDISGRAFIAHFKVKSSTALTKLKISRRAAGNAEAK